MDTEVGKELAHKIQHAVQKSCEGNCRKKGCTAPEQMSEPALSLLFQKGKKNPMPLLYIKSLYQAKDHKCIQKVFLARDASNSLSYLGTAKSLTSYKTINLHLNS